MRCRSYPISFAQKIVIPFGTMIPFAVPIAFAVLAFLTWGYDARARRAYEATSNEAEKRQFRALRRVHPSKWRAARIPAQKVLVTARDLDEGSRRNVFLGQLRKFAHTRRRSLGSLESPVCLKGYAPRGSVP